VQADAGKAGGTVESLLIEHARLNKIPRALARMVCAVRRNPRSPMPVKPSVRAPDFSPQALPANCERPSRHSQQPQASHALCTFCNFSVRDNNLLASLNPNGHNHFNHCVWNGKSSS
jgi:hypothetical protein